MADNKDAARSVLEDVISKGNLDLTTELLDADYHDHDPANEEDVRGPDAFNEEVSGYRAGFPDIQFTLEDQVGDGDLVATRWTMRGTHQGDLFGIPPSNNKVEIAGITIFRFADGKIQEGWWNWDRMGMMQQVGAIPAEQPA
jgi:steroid delta-isomerase-like uncharacterized protein